jgi:hypothetical protein
MGQQALVQLAGEHRDAVHPGVMAEEVAGHADLAAAAGHQHLLIKVVPLLVAAIVRRWVGGQPCASGAGWGSSHDNTSMENVCTSRSRVVLASSGATPGGAPGGNDPSVVGRFICSHWGVEWFDEEGDADPQQEMPLRWAL